MRQALLATDQQTLLEQKLLPALEQYLVARDLCPLLSAPQLRLAIHGEKLTQAEPRQLYLARAKALRPSDADLLYLCGVQELKDGQIEEAQWSWRRSLECSSVRLADIVDRARQRPQAVPFLEQILPADPHTLAAAATLLAEGQPPLPGDPLLHQALELLNARVGQLSARDWHLKATTHQSLGQNDPAQQAYRMALMQEPHNTRWRYQLAELLFLDNRLAETRRELRLILEQHPSHADALSLLDLLDRRESQP
jgi:tetratricopeptide (TPR) repeat protein